MCFDLLLIVISKLSNAFFDNLQFIIIVGLWFESICFDQTNKNKSSN